MTSRYCIVLVVLAIGLLTSAVGFNVFLDEPDSSEDQFLVSYDDDGTVIWEQDGSSHTEDQYQSLSRFWILTEDEETFASPVVEVLGSTDPNKLKDDVVTIIYHGDAAYGTLQDDYDDDIDSDYLPMSLWVVYVCHKEGESRIRLTIEVSPSLDSNSTRTYAFTWTKKCGSGTRRGFHVYREFDPDPVVQDGKVQYPWNAAEVDESGLTEVLASEHTTSFYVVVDRGSQVFNKPTLRVQPEGALRASVHGVSEDLTVVEQADTDADDDLDSYATEDRTWIHVYYDECTGTAPSATVRMSVNLPPFKPLDITWRKNCEAGGPKRGLFLSSTRTNRGDVISDGEVSPSWASPLADNLKVVPVDQDRTTFYLTPGPGEDVSKVIVSSPDSLGVGSVVAVAASVDSSTFPNKIVVTYNCKQRGEATIRMMIPLGNHDPLMLYWKKRCPILRPPDYQPQPDEAYWTANQLLVLFCFLVAAAVGVAGYLYLRVKKNRRIRQMQLAQEQLG